jgi:3-methylcrotonyl-CoA carboxylase alpha subunit
VAVSKVFNKILIANRGEIACRVIHTCKRMGIKTVAVYSDADKNAQHVLLADEAIHIGGPRPVDSYLRGDRILEATKKTGAQAIHPGYGFLSENADFARQCEKAGIVFIGPTPDAIDKMGSKSAAKIIMQAAGVPVVPGYHGDNQEIAFLHKEADKTGYPLLIKAVAGGGGKGMRLVNHSSEFIVQLDAAKREAKNAFGNDAVLLERFVQGPHHIEFQVFGDAHGNVVHLFERECSIQRRHQKILEETPSPFIMPDMRNKMGDTAVAAAKAIHYRGAGTIEFIVGSDRDFYFMEMNTRLQVEHPITEMTTGQDLVEWQLRVAAGEALPLKQNEIRQQGHAIEVRLCAENPANQFLPETGKLSRFIIPSPSDSVRVDSGFTEGDEVGVFYDSMIAKLIAFGENRAQAIKNLQQAIGETAVIGLTTNIPFLEKMAFHPAFAQGNTTTAFVENHLADLLHQPTVADDTTLYAACARLLMDSETHAETKALAHADPWSPWNIVDGWRVNSAALRKLMLADALSGTTHSIMVESISPIGKPKTYQLHHVGHKVLLECEVSDGIKIDMSFDGAHSQAGVLRHGHHLTVLQNGTRFDLEEVRPYEFETAEEVPGGRLTALMPGRIVKLLVANGDEVKQGQPLLIMEAMKMEHTIHSPRDGVVARVVHKPDDIVAADALLFEFEQAAE